MNNKGENKMNNELKNELQKLPFGFEAANGTIEISRKDTTVSVSEWNGKIEIEVFAVSPDCDYELVKAITVKNAKEAYDFANETLRSL